MLERYELSIDRIKEIQTEEILTGNIRDYFVTVAKFIEGIEETLQFIKESKIEECTLEELQDRNHKLYEDVLPDRYEASYANPTYAVAKLGEEYGQMLSFLYAELRGLIGYVYEQDLFNMTIRMELFLEIYHSFIYEQKENKRFPKAEEIKETIYWFVCDYAEDMMEDNVANSFDPKRDFAYQIIMNSDLSDCKYLYQFGEYITENELQMATYMSQLPEEKVKLMADTYTQGYQLGFAATQKDITIKNTVGIRYFIGMERMIKAAIANFKEMGLTPVITRAHVSVINGRNLKKNGYYGAIANKQFEYDHEYDKTLFFDKQCMNRRLEAYKSALELYKKQANDMGGPAVIQDFGATPFVPVNKKENLVMSEEGQKNLVEFASKSGALINEYVKGEERSFTIIAFPVPAIGENFTEIFDEIIKINTLNYQLYQGIQQTIIDTLDQAEYVIVKGAGNNKTDLKIQLWKLQNPEKETIFENCVADVNIPVGEVFTSPVLKGTTGILHVTKVFLNELEYRDLELEFTDGMVTDYSCKNFDTQEENKKYIKENVLYHHDTLPMGEFAIGTNTRAYVAAKKYQIEDILPILIAEKMGPHFAIGDTCYSHEEDMTTYNPDGKAIVARENEVSSQRNIDIRKAYLNCHTDITIPYDELDVVIAVTENKKEIKIIEKGRFVLKGCEELNKPFDE
ncbi:MAG: aminopeptidase [Eubacteriales bacterium]